MGRWRPWVAREPSWRTRCGDDLARQGGAAHGRAAPLLAIMRKTRPCLPAAGRRCLPEALDDLFGFPPEPQGITEDR